MDFQVDLVQRSLVRNGHSISLKPRSFDLLVYFLRNPQRVVTEDELMVALWQGVPVEESDFGQHLFLLRKALATGEPDALSVAGSDDNLIMTVPGRGYEFTASVRGLDIPAEARHELSAEIRSNAASGQRLLAQASGFAAERGKSGQDKSERGKSESASSESVADTRESESGSQSGRSATLLHLGPPLYALIGCIVLLTIAGCWLGLRSLNRARPDSLRIVIDDFQNATDNPDFDLSLKTALTIDVQQSPYLSITPDEKLHDVLAVMQLPAGQRLLRQQISNACQRLNDQVYLTGSLHTFALKYLITVQAFNCANGNRVGQSRGIADTPDGVVAILDKVAADLRRQLGEPTKSVQDFSKPLFAGRSPSLIALKAYSYGIRVGIEGKETDSVPLFQQAIEIDPKFALAYANLGATYRNLGQNDPAAAAITRAYGLRDTVDAQSLFLIVALYNNVVTGDLLAAIRNYQSWIAAYPHNPVPLSELADIEIQVGKPALALEAVHRALAINPQDANSYVVLARAQMHLGRFEEATATCRQAIRRHLDGPPIHVFLFQIGYLRLDQPAMDEQIAWAQSPAAGKAGEPYMLQQQGLMDFALGKAKSAQTVLGKLVDGSRKQGQLDLANRVQNGIPRINAEVGLTDSAYEELQRMPEAQASTDSLADVSVAWAHVGETTRAETLLKRALAAHPASTLWQQDNGPQITAAIALNQKKPESAIEALHAASASAQLDFDLRDFALPALRGRAYLAAKEPALAEAEFHKILDHPGIEPLSYQYALAQLGLARALVQQDKLTEAGFAYKVFFQIWKDADPDLPRLKEAKAEYAKLTDGEPTPVVHNSASHRIANPRRK